MMKYLLITLVFLITTGTNAQTSIKELKPGDELPDFVIPKIIHSSKRSLNIFEFKDRLLIIDFWATTCSGCVAALPKMEMLQKRFGEKIKILPVTYEPEYLVLSFWKQNKYIKNLTLPSVIEDKIFKTYFKYQVMPHEVWVYKGKVIAITPSEYVDESNINRVLSGEHINWPVKNDFYVFDRSKPLFIPNTNQVDTSNTFMKYSAISDYKEGVSSELTGGAGVVRDAQKKTVRAYFVNGPIFNIYNFYWGTIIRKNDTLIRPASGTILPNQVIWQVSDKSKYIYESKSGYSQDWIRKNGICFESLNADSGQTDEQIYKIAISDLNGLLGLKVRWEKRKEKVLVLVKTGKVKQSLKGESYPISGIDYKLNQYAENPYVFSDCKTDTSHIKLDIKSWTDLTSIRNALNNYGYDLREEQREVHKLIFAEVDGGLLVDGQMQSEIEARKNQQSELQAPSAEENKSFLEKNSKQKGVVVLPSGLQYKILKAGKGAIPLANSKVSVNYTGMLVNGKIFDSSYQLGKPAEFAVNGLIAGLTEALKIMPEGSKWIIYIPSALAYGSHTAEGKILPNSTLIFELELLKILP